MKLNPLLLALCVSAFALMLPAPATAQPAAQALSGKLAVTGSSTLAPLVTELARRFRLLHPGVEIAVEAGGSGRGAADARSGKADIGMVSRALHPDENSLFAFTIARDGIALVVHRDNAVKALGRAQFIALLSGKTANWKEVGGADAPVHVISRTPGHASIEIVSYFFGLSPEDIKPQRITGDNAEALRAVLEDRNALSFFSVGLAESSARKGQPLRALDVDGVPASSATVRDGSYPLARQLNLVTRAVPKGAGRAFIEFALSPQARDIIRQYGFVPYEN